MQFDLLATVPAVMYALAYLAVAFCLIIDVTSDYHRLLCSRWTFSCEDWVRLGQKWFVPLCFGRSYAKVAYFVNVLSCLVWPVYLVAGTLCFCLSALAFNGHENKSTLRKALAILSNGG